MHTRSLTPKQSEILEYIIGYLSATGMPPTFREIGENLNIKSTNGVRCLLIALEKKGVIRLIPNVSRGIQVVSVAASGKGASKSIIPFLGRIAAGNPVVSEEQTNEYVEFPSFFGRTVGSLFALKVQGQSMIDLGINDGDTIIVERESRAENGDIIAALLNGEVTVKTFEKVHKATPHDVVARLLPANNKFKPINITKEDEFRIIGKIRGLLRKY